MESRDASLESLTQDILVECIELSNKLISMIDYGKDEMSHCVQGEILREYQKSMDKVASIADMIKKDLSVLPTE